MEGWGVRLSDIGLASCHVRKPHFNQDKGGRIMDDTTVQYVRTLLRYLPSAFTRAEPYDTVCPALRTTTLTTPAVLTIPGKAFFMLVKRFAAECGPFGLASRTLCLEIMC